jgi:hypothetical protein
LKKVRAKRNCTSQFVYSLDEPGLSTLPTKVRNVISSKEIRHIAKVASAERGKNITVVCSMNACGVYFPLGLIFPRKRMNPELLHACPTGAVGHARDLGYMTGEVFVLYLNHFVEHAKPSVGPQILYLAENHASHIFISSINFCPENRVVVVRFPPHTSCSFQLIEVSFFGPLNTFHIETSDNLMVSNPGKISGKDNRNYEEYHLL